MSSDSFNERIRSALNRLTLTHRRRVRRCVEMISTTECLVDGHQCISFATNDYLGLTRHPRVLAAFAQTATLQAGAGASALIAGRSKQNAELEKALATFEGTESAILFPSGYAANTGAITTLVGLNDAVFCDRDNHASLIDGCRHSAGKFFVYDRMELERLSESIAKRRKDFEHTFIVTDSVFSMDGTLAPLPQLCDIAEHFDSTVIVDEAHGTGVFGVEGRGVCELQNVQDRVAVKIGTLSKTIGGLGGFVAGSESLCEWLWNNSRSQFFSTALPPAVTAAAAESLRVIVEEPERRSRLAAAAIFARQTLQECELTVLFDQTSPPSSPIIAVLIGDDNLAVRVSRRMLESGFFVPAVRPPTVAPGTARLRISVCCDHTLEMIRQVVYQLRDVLKSER
jgi:8-amino-7-oxononanoate synthase